MFSQARLNRFLSSALIGGQDPTNTSQWDDGNTNLAGHR
jgi:hypothetical protein